VKALKLSLNHQGGGLECNMKRSKRYSCRVQGRRRKLEGGEDFCTYSLACGTLLDTPFCTYTSLGFCCYIIT
jgi:hypothetical protein